MIALPIALIVLGAWLALWSWRRVHSRVDLVMAEENWRSADEWVVHARELRAWNLELAARCMLNAAECERQAAEWFVKGCGG
jgi:hypothetical protein